MKSPLLIATVLLVFLDVSFVVVLVEPEESPVALVELGGALVVVPCFELAAAVGLFELVGLAAVFDGAELPVICVQSCGDGPENVASVVVPLQPPLPQHIHCPEESSYWM